MDQVEDEGIFNLELQKPRSQFKGVELSRTSNSNSIHYTFDT